MEGGGGCGGSGSVMFVISFGLLAWCFLVVLSFGGGGSEGGGVEWFDVINYFFYHFFSFLLVLHDLISSFTHVVIKVHIHYPTHFITSLTSEGTSS